jgi:hypothetical protein
MTVRVIRVLEYSFPDQATAEKVLAAGAVPANGVRYFGEVVVRSATTWPEEVPPPVGVTDERAEFVQLQQRLDSLKFALDDVPPAVWKVEPEERKATLVFGKDSVPCGNPDKHCGAVGGTARCGGCRG